MPPVSETDQENSDESIIKDAICIALFGRGRVTADDLFRYVATGLPCSREDFDRLLSELIDDRRVAQTGVDSPVYRLTQS